MLNENRIVPYETSELPVAQGPWLVFAPHADDETFGMGGTLAKAARMGIQIHLVVMTDGALGGSSKDLVATRQREAVAAAEFLGLQAPVFLGNPDRSLRLQEKTLDQVRRSIETVQPAAVFFPGCFELHPDHRTTAALVWRVLKEFSENSIIPVSYEVLVQSPVNILVDITAQVDTKIGAMEIYTSQLAENRYKTIALALNQLRSLTLNAQISHAEGFYRHEPRDVNADLHEKMLAKIREYFAVEQLG